MSCSCKLPPLSPPPPPALPSPPLPPPLPPLCLHPAQYKAAASWCRVIVLRFSTSSSQRQRKSNLHFYRANASCSLSTNKRCPSVSFSNLPAFPVPLPHIRLHVLSNAAQLHFCRQMVLHPASASREANVTRLNLMFGAKTQQWRER